MNTFTTSSNEHVIGLHHKCNKSSFYFAPCMGAKNCNQRVYMSVCQFVCLSVHSHISEATRLNFTQFLHVNCGRSSISNPLCTSSFVDVLSCFHIIERIGIIKDDAYVWSSSPNGGIRGEVCRLLLRLVCS